ncbi:glycoside hydrolase family 43 protein [Amphibacillus xylanus]|uniref:Arabinoxylan arabinofuranohydrolase n=1 Tax=Amphibacillus xylanus (strain ATCC 51415 / DSM 6626 / JCM 7361 / LMG 17667 / NBRC 15112 / Ep01) TaxID=698758 RepID=K0J0W4_AMPXN|nr:glycoside hydrolase 43 family protein [Amphibacillus xylanus]BAM48505.1 arabinoxylan arabinofuranohydrolase [Amphibacillus xylanus NBRC 15112]
MSEIVKAINPIVPLDYPDPDVIRVDDTYYMVTTTMHFMPGCEILRSYDLVNWEHAAFVYDKLDSTPAQRLENGQNIYGKGMWAASIRHHKGKFYVIFAANDTRKTYLFTAEQVEGPWEKSEIEGFYHDSSLLFDDDDRVYLVYGNRDVQLIELESDLSKPKEGGINRTIVSDRDNPNLGYEGAHFYKINQKYYVFLIRSLPDRWMRVEGCFVADSIDGEFKGGDIFIDDRNYCGQGVAQGGIVDTPDGDWYAILFQDHGAVGRIPILLPIKWENDFPVFGAEGKVPTDFTTKSTRPNYSYQPLVNSDDFKQRYDNTYGLAPIWQFNHEPIESDFSINEDKGYFELRTSKVTNNILDATNTLTTRMLFPHCAAEVTVDASQIKDGDVTGFSAFQGAYGFVGITKQDSKYYLIMRTKPLDNLEMQSFDPNETPEKEWERIEIDHPTMTFRIEADFWQMKDEVKFLYQKDDQFIQIGPNHQTAFRLDHFTGCRFGLFYYSTEQSGGTVQFSQFKYIK